MSEKYLYCCLCKQDFSANNLPRMFPHCEHSACTRCLKQSFAQKVKQLKCSICGCDEKLNQWDMQYFPKNVTLAKMIKQNTQNNKSGMESISNIQMLNPVCKVHEKQMEIICLTDKQRICSHCALFDHKGHQFKTIQETELEISKKKKVIESIKSRKIVIENKLSSQEFKDEVIRKITVEKERLVSEVKKKFGQIYQNIKLAQKNVYEDIIKNLKLVYEKIQKFQSQESQAHKIFANWEASCMKIFSKIDKEQKIQRKCLYCFHQLDQCLLGEQLIKKLEQNLQFSKKIINKSISSIKIVENLNISNSLFNYINVFTQFDEDNNDKKKSLEVEDNISKKIPSDSPPQTSLLSIQTSRPPLPNQSRISLTRRSQKKSENGSTQKKATTKPISNEKRNSAKSLIVTQSPSSERANVEKMVEQFCLNAQLQTLDISGYSLNDSEICDILKYVKQVKKLKGLKIMKNYLTSEGLSNIIAFIDTVTNLNVAFNELDEHSLSILTNIKEKLPVLRIINVSNNNKINERKLKTVQAELKKQGVILTI